MSGKGTTLKGITVEIGGDTTKLGDAILKARKSASDLSGELRGVESLLKLDPTNTILLAQKQDILAESINQAKDKLKMLHAAEMDVEHQFAAGKISTAQYRDFNREIEATEQAIKRLEDAAYGGHTRLDALSNATRESDEKLSALGRELDNVNGLLKNDSDNTVLLSQKQEILSQATAEAASKLQKLTDAQDYMDKAMSRGKISGEQYREFGREIESTRQQLARLEAAASGTDDAVADVGDAAEEAGEKAEKASGGWTVLKGVMSDLASSAIKAAVSTVVDGAKKMVSAGLEYNQAMEGYVTNFTTMLGGSAEAANGMVGSLQKLASATPLAMSDLAGGAQTLLAFGVASDDVSGTLQRLGDISLGNADKMQSLARAYGKATAQGKLTGETVQMMIDAGWNPLIDICDQTGESMEDVQKRMAAGSISAEELTQAVNHATDAGGKFAGGMEAASKTVAGLTSTLQDNVNAMMGELMQPVSDAMLSTLLPTAIDAVDQLTTAFEDEGIDGFSRVAGSLIASLSAQLVSYAPQAIPAALSFIGALVTGLLLATPDLTGTAIELVGALLIGIADQLPGIITAAMSALLGLSLIHI